MKTCSKCKIEKDVSEFRKAIKNPDGLQYYCKDCANEATRVWNKNRDKESRDKHNERERQKRKENPEKFRAYDKTEKRREQRRLKEKRRRERNPERCREINRKSREKRERENPGIAYQNTKKWCRDNPGKRNAQVAKREAAKLQRTPPWLSKEQLKEIEEFYVLAKELQWLNDPADPLTVDHIIPMQGKNISGLHVPWNLQILPRSLNSSKNNRLI